MKTTKLFIAFLSLVFVIGCNSKKQHKDNHKDKTASYTPLDYTYPTDSTTINTWIKDSNFKAMYKHSWSVWQHLTTPEGNGKLRYQTWSSPAQIIKKLNNPNGNTTQEHLFKKPAQFGHAIAKQADFDDTKIVEVVAYNKASEAYAIENKIFYLSSLASFQNGDYSQIPDFPSEAINIKPVYKIITKDKLDGDIYTMSSWNGPEYQTAGYPESDWKSCIHVNIAETNATDPNGRADYACDSITAENTYFLNDFIHFKISANQATAYNKEISNETHKASAGDIALLVGMHVTTKEIKRWVWQTYWWSPTPLTPNVPSSTDIAASRNGIKLHGAANHYAMGVAYSMLIPAQPYVGGKNEGELVITFNPYLESGFGEGTFTGSTSYVYNRGEKIETDLGVTTNCMSCHMAAVVNTNDFNPNGGIYYGDTYLDYKDPMFKDNLMVDFAWSVQGNVVTDK